MAWNRIDQQPEILSCDLNFLLLENVPQKIPGCGNLTTSKVPLKKVYVYFIDSSKIKYPSTIVLEHGEENLKQIQ